MTSSQPEANADAAAAVARRLVLGHRRLAIVDLSPLGHQPMRRGNHLHAVFNGEIYNHIELRAELQAQGHAFESHSDTEVLLAAYQHWGQQAWARLNGMWAIAIHDARRRSLVIARDRFGVKPLYVWSGPQGVLLLASEIKALLAHPDVRAQAEPAACAQFAISGPTTWRDDTMFVGIRRFPAGHWAEVPVDAAGRLNPVPYWSAPDVDPGALHVPFDAATADRLSPSVPLAAGRCRAGAHAHGRSFRHSAFRGARQFPDRGAGECRAATTRRARAAGSLLQRLQGPGA